MAKKQIRHISSDYVIDWFQGVIDDLTENLATMRDSQNHNRYASGDTARDIGAYNKVGVTVHPDKILIELGMPEHYDFIDKGVKGVERVPVRTGSSPYQFRNIRPNRKMVNALLPWMRARGIVPRNSAGKRINSNINQRLTSLAYAIATGLKKKGIEAVPFYSEVVNDARIKMLEDRFLELYGEETLDKLEFVFT